MPTLSRVLLLSAILSTAGGAWAAGGGSTRMPEPRASAQTPEQLAKSAYNTGVRGVKKADELAAGSARMTDPVKQEKAARRANDAYKRALAKFESAVGHDPGMHEAWNYVGYARRQLGDLDAALAAYDRALAIQPGYAQAIEYRGQAYLKLNRLSDAKQAYLDLYAGNRLLADQLLAAMREWIGANRAATADAAGLDDFEKWVQERVAIAGQTAALTREGTAAAWD
ncbi:MAG: tetratricopeptide repeat protein [Gammaproteobacteria bacterium]